MNVVFRALLFASLLAVAWTSSAQVSNGDFTGGSSSWKWRQGIKNGALSMGDCFNVMEEFQPFNSSDTPREPAPSGSRYAVLTGPQFDAAGSWTTCRQIEQDVYIQPGSRVAFDAMLGENLFSGTTGQVYPVTLYISILDPTSNVEAIVFEASGSSRVCGDYQTCLGFEPRTANVSAFWGKTVKVRIRTVSRFFITTIGIRTGNSGARVDNVRLERMPVQNWPMQSGSWYNQFRSGHGVHLSRAGNGTITLIWYTYLPNGRPVWYISDSLPIVSGIWQSPIFKSTWNASSGTNSVQPIGDVRIEMVGKNEMAFYWDLYSINGNNTGFDGAEPFSFLSGGGSYTGLWYEPAYSGWGISLEYMDNPQGIDTVATAFYYDGTEPVWAQGAVEGTPTGNKLIELTRFTGIGLCPECVGQQAQMFPWPAGILSLSLDGGAGWIDAQSHSGNRWQRGSAAQPAGIVQMTGP